jgi:hypothetical protein
VKRIPALRDLSDDHHTALVLARRCRQAAGAGGGDALDAVWDQVLEAFDGHLAPHFQIEERLLVPALETIGEPALASRVRADHTALRALVETASPSRAVVEQFGLVLESHVRFEEREVFELAQSRLPAATLEAIAEACRTTPRVCPAALRA